MFIAVHLRIHGEVNRPHCLGTIKTWLFQENIGDIGEPEGQIRSKQKSSCDFELGPQTQQTPREINSERWNSNQFGDDDYHSNDANDVEMFLHSSQETAKTNT